MSRHLDRNKDKASEDSQADSLNPHRHQAEERHVSFRQAECPCHLPGPVLATSGTPTTVKKVTTAAPPDKRCQRSAVALISALARPWVKVLIVEPSAAPW